LQRKFQILVRKIELWYVSDIGAVVNTTIMLHNMMVAQRINNDEYEECESFYAFGSSEVEERQRDDCVSTNKSNKMSIVGWRRLIYIVACMQRRMLIGNCLRISRRQSSIRRDFSMPRGGGSACMIGRNTIDCEMRVLNS
jgi:hypothetical protein